MDFEKVAIYVDEDGSLTHAARQFDNGSWTSKLGSWQDIEHRTLQALERTASIYGYGNVSLFLRRPANISSD